MIFWKSFSMPKEWIFWRLEGHSSAIKEQWKFHDRVCELSQNSLSHSAERRKNEILLAAVRLLKVSFSAHTNYKTDFSLLSANQ